jgi:O-antigen ligase
MQWRMSHSSTLYAVLDDGLSKFSLLTEQPFGSIVTTPESTLQPPRRIRLYTAPLVADKGLTLNSVAFGLFSLFVFAIPWENALLFPGIGTVGRLLGLVTLPVAILAILDRSRLRRPSLPLALMGLFVMWGSLTYLWTANMEATSIRITSWLQNLGMIWLIWEFADSRARQLMLARSYVFGTLVSAVDTLSSYLRGQEAYYQRYAGSGFDPNDLGLILALSLPMSFYLATIQKNQCAVWVYRIQQILAILAIGLTSSRAALVAAVVALLYVPLVLLWTKTFREKCVFFALIVVVSSCMVSFLPENSWKRWAGIGSELQHGTWGKRKVIWSAGFDLFREHPSIGVGAGSFGTATHHALPASIAKENPFLPAAHNTFLSILAEEGLLGFALLLLLLFSLVQPVLRLPAIERSLWLVVLATWATGVFTLTWEDRKPTWFLFGLIASWTGLRALPQKTSERARNLGARWALSGDFGRG